MAHLAKEEHQRRIKAGYFKSAHIQFDEMETFEHTRLKPLSIPLAVRARTGQIIGASVATMNCKGPLAAISRQKYGVRVDTRQSASQSVLELVEQCSKKDIRVVTDNKQEYGGLIKKCVPHAKHEKTHRQCKSAGDKSDRRNKNDKMFTLNASAAKIRHDLSRMARRVWVTTKKPEYLQAHLDLYIAYNNKYELAA